MAQEGIPELLGRGAGFALGIMLLPVGWLAYLGKELLREYEGFEFFKAFAQPARKG